SEIEALVREQAMQRFLTPVTAELIPAATLAHRQWTATRITACGAGYNTKLIGGADVPKRYEDLLDPKWKGKLAVEAGGAQVLLQPAPHPGEGTEVRLAAHM